jgi:hypothetical protein
MSNPTCAVCGHVNRASAEVCEMCASRLGAPAGEPDAYASYAYGGGGRAGATHADIPSPRFRGVSDVAGPTLKVYRENFLLIVALVVVATVPAVLLQYGLLQALAAAAAGDATAPAGPGGAFAFALMGSVPVWLLTVAGAALLDGSLVYAVLDIQRTGSASVGESLRRGLKVLPKIFVVNLVYAVVVGVGCLLLVVPGVIFSLMYALVVPVAVAEGRGPLASFTRSSELTRGYKLLIFLTYFLWGIAIAVINLIISASFSYGGHQNSFAAVMTEALASGILNSSSAVLTVYIYLGLLRERGKGYGARVFTHEAGPAAL